MTLPTRKPNRLENYDYGKGGAYFITICTKNRQQILSEIPTEATVGADIIRPKLSKYGEIADVAINAIPLHYSNIKIDKYIIMPDHIHLILIIFDEHKNGRIISAPTPTIMTVIGQMKRWISKKIGFSLWQKSYYDHIIRDEEDYINICQYIDQNPLK